MSLIQPHLHWSYLHLCCCQFTLSFLSYIHLESDWLKRSLSGYNSMSLGRFGRWCAERGREKRGLTYSSWWREEERIRSEVLTCAAAAAPCLIRVMEREGEGGSQMLFFQRYGPHRQLLTVDSIQFISASSQGRAKIAFSCARGFIGDASLPAGAFLITSRNLLALLFGQFWVGEHKFSPNLDSLSVGRHGKGST